MGVGGVVVVVVVVCVGGWCVGGWGGGERYAIIHSVFSLLLVKAIF